MHFARSTQLLVSPGSRRLLTSLSLAALALAASPSAHAHITLMNPPSWVMEDAEGDPQKAAPCGGMPGAAGLTQTNVVTPFSPGQTIPVMWKETIGHPGHFRISIAKNRSELVDPPVVTTNGDGVSGNSISATIMTDVEAPVVADGLFARPTVAGAQAQPFMQMVTLPTEPGEYTLQVIQFMAQHAPGYFYHHCADIRIMADGATGSAGAGSGVVGQAGSANTGAGGSSSTAGSGGASATPDDAADDGEEDDGGCALQPGSRATSSAAAVLLLGLAAALGRRRSVRCR